MDRLTPRAVALLAERPEGLHMVEGSYELHPARWQSIDRYPEWVSRCQPNEKASLLTPEAAVRPSFRDRDNEEFPTGRIREIREIGGVLHADVAWDSTSVETVPIWAIVEVDQ